MFDSDIDVYVPKEFLLDIQDLADMYEVNYFVYQTTAYVFNVCVQFEEKLISNIEEFINTVKQALIGYQITI